MVGRTGAVAIAALVLVPVAGFAARRRWGALVLGGTVSILALMLVPALFTHFSDAVSLSQSRRAAGFVPFAFAFAGGLAIVTRTVLLAPLALVAGIVLQRAWPGDFGYNLRHGGPGRRHVVRAGRRRSGAGARPDLRAATARASGTSRVRSPPSSSCCRSPCTASSTGARCATVDPNALSPALRSQLRGACRRARS